MHTVFDFKYEGIGVSRLHLFNLFFSTSVDGAGWPGGWALTRGRSWARASMGATDSGGADWCPLVGIETDVDTRGLAVTDNAMG